MNEKSLSLFTNILLCTDNSADARAAEEFAFATAKRFSARLTVLQIYELPSIPESIPDDEFIRSYNVQKQSILAKRFAGYDDNLSIVAMHRNSTVAKTILDYAGTIHPDTIIVGTHGTTGLLTTPFGSTALSILNQSTFPVFAVPGAAEYKPLQKILVATKWLGEEAHVISNYAEWLRKANIELHFVHVVTDEVERDTDLQTINQLLQGIPYSVTNIKSDYLAEVLEMYALQNKVDSLLIFSEIRNILNLLFKPSLVKQTLFQSSVPILYLPR